MLREVCASKTNTPAVVRSKHHANDDTLERALGNVCPFFFHGQKLGVFQIKLINTYGAPVLCCEA